MVLLPVCRIFLSFRCCCPVKLFWIPKYQGRIPCSLFSPFRYFCDAEKSDSHEQRCSSLHLLLQIREFLPTVGHPCHQDEAGPCLWCHFRHDDYAPWRTHGRKRLSGVLFPENKNIGLLWWKHPYFWGKTTVLLPKEVRCFASSGPLHRILPSPPLQKKFLKISYISYTTASDVLYLLAIPGEG